VPGIALVAGEGVRLGGFENALRTMAHPGYVVTPLARTECLAVGYSAHSGYPLHVIKDDDCVVALEGAVYGPKPDQLDADLRLIAQLFVADPDAGRQAAERFARSADGDFNLLLLVPSQNRMLLVNDTLGRLPLFYLQSASTLALAREIKFLRAWNAREPQPDRVAIAQTLMFGWPLGSRTQEEHIQRLPEASTVYAAAATGTIQINPYRIWNFDEIAQTRTRYDSPNELAELFINRCVAQSRWAANRPLLVSLSGGLDSRTVAAGLQRAGTPFTAVTFSDAAQENRADVIGAKQVADALGAPWKPYTLGEATWDASELLVHLRDGQNYIGVAYMLDFLSRLRQDFGDACYLTGDGGDKTLYELTYPPLARSLDQLLNLVVSNAIWPVGTIALLLGMSPGEILESIRAQFCAYPERSPAGRQARFGHAEHARHWLFEGEDRNRAFLWSMTPFYAQSFYGRALAVPASRKRRFSYYADFMRALNPLVANIPNANWGASVGSPKALARGTLQAAAVRMPQPIKNTIRRRILRFHSTASVDPQYAALLAQLRKQPDSSGVFSAPTMIDVLANGCSRVQFNTLVTQFIYQAQATAPYPSSASWPFAEATSLSRTPF
jgi:asparagine synthase (glutamine-hydrolysing)